MSLSAESSAVVIYHHPGCGTSNQVLALLLAAGCQPTVIEYLTTGWTHDQLVSLFNAAGLSPLQALRTKNLPPEAELRVAGHLEDEALIEAMIAEPILVNRPFVCTPKGVRLARPADVVFELL